MARPLAAARLPRTLVAVVRERWPWEHVRFALVGLGAWYLTYAAFRNLKSFVPFVNRNLWDSTLAHLDRLIFLGHDPATVLHTCSASASPPQVFSFVYVAWIVFVPVSLVVALVWSRDRTGGAWYVTAVAVDWVLGVATYFLVPTLGPVYAQPQDFVALPHTYVTTLQDAMIQDRHTVLFDPFATHAVQTIAAFASLHVGIMVTVCLMAELLHMKRWVRVAMWVFLALTVLATVYLGWHYFVDTLGGAVLGAAGVWIAALGTGNHERGRPRLTSRASRRPPPAGAASPGSRSARSARRQARAAGRRTPRLPPRRTSCGARRSRAARRPSSAGTTCRWRCGDALADGVVHRHEGALRAQAVDHRRREPLAGLEERVAQRRGEVGQGHDVPARAPAATCPLNTGRMSRNADHVLGRRARSSASTSPGDDLAEQAVRHRRSAPFWSRRRARLRAPGPQSGPQG